MSVFSVAVPVALETPVIWKQQTLYNFVMCAFHRREVSSGEIFLESRLPVILRYSFSLTSPKCQFVRPKERICDDGSPKVTFEDLPSHHGLAHHTHAFTSEFDARNRARVLFLCE